MIRTLAYVFDMIKDLPPPTEAEEYRGMTEILRDLGISMILGAVREVLLGIRTVAEMIEAFADEEKCRRLLEAMVWPSGRVCPVRAATSVRLHWRGAT
jgi:hypothetical protein